MIVDSKYYKPQYKTATGRALYLIATKAYGSSGKLALDLGISKQYVANCIGGWDIPVKYAGFLGRKWGFHPGILAYPEWLVFETPYSALEYSSLVDDDAYTFFTGEDIEYILEGTYLKDPVKYLRLLDKKIGEE